MRYVFTIFLLIFFSLAFCQDKNANSKDDFQNWRLSVGPYLWFIGIKGEVVNPPFPNRRPIDSRLDIDKSFLEIMNSLEFGLSMNIEYNKNKWTGIVNVASFTIDGEDITPDEYIIINILYRFKTIFGDAKIGYQFFSNDKFHMDAFIGSQLNYTQLTATLNAGSSDIRSDQQSNFSVEPIIATRVTYIPHSRLELSAYIDYGIIRSDGELTNQYKIDMRYLATKWLYSSLGYKYWIFKQPRNKAVINGQVYGFYLRVGAQF